MGFFLERFFEEEYALLKWKISKRLLPPILIILIAKIALTLLLYTILNIGTYGTFWMDPNRVPNLIQNQVLFEYLETTPSWAYTYVGWDSAWYLSIQTKGYDFSTQSYAFSPMFPFIGRIVNLLFSNPIMSQVVCSFIFGVVWIPVFQSVAEYYMSKTKAFFSALIFGLSPYVFLFTTVAYTEGLFLFTTLNAWYYFKKNSIESAAGFASIAALARINGVIIALPFFLNSLLRKQSRKKYWVAFSVAPILALMGWLLYCKFTADDFLAFMHSTEWSSMYSLRTLITEGLPQKGLAVFRDAFQNSPDPLVGYTPFAVILAVIVPAFLILKAWKLDKPLTSFFLFSYVGILMFGALVSLPRYISGLFPVWIMLTYYIPVTKRTMPVLVAILIISSIVGLKLWIDFLNGSFIA